MAININSFKTFIEMISNKPQSGFPFSINKFNEAVKYAVIEFYKKQYKEFENTKDITDTMQPFLKSVLLPIDINGKAILPNDYVHMTSVRFTYYKNDIPKTVDVKYVRNNDVSNFLSSSIVEPTKRYPILTYYDTYIQFFPKTLSRVNFDYLRLPVNPIWAYTTVNNRPVYDPTNSVDIEFAPEEANAIAFMVCSFMGANMRENELIKYSEMQKVQIP